MVEKNEYPKASNLLVYGGTLLYIGGICLMIAFCSPYWIESFEQTHSTFKNMGLWQYCFNNFRYPYYQFDHLFNGCHNIFSAEYFVIREWLLPGWLLAVQTFVTIAFITSFAAQIIIALIIVRYPLKFVLKYEWLLSIFAFVGSSISTGGLFFGIIIFSLSSSRRDWLMYPNFNHLSWSYGFAIISMFFHALASMLLYREKKESYERRREAHNLVAQMQPEPSSRVGFY